MKMTSSNKWAIRNHPRQKSFLDLIKSQDAGTRINRSRDWFRKQAQTTGGVQVGRIEDTMKDRLTTKLSYGRMYLFWYDPKLKKDLPYYDRFPLVFPIDPKEDGFLGINLHYLPYMARAQLMDALYSLLTNDKMDDTTKLKVGYGILKGVRKFRNFRPCIKHYLNNHIRSRFLDVPADQWDIALFLPLERFAKATKQRVFDESMQKIWRSGS